MRPPRHEGSHGESYWRQRQRGRAQVIASAERVRAIVDEALAAALIEATGNAEMSTRYPYLVKYEPRGTKDLPPDAQYGPVAQSAHGTLGATALELIEGGDVLGLSLMMDKLHQQRQDDPTINIL